MTVKIKVALQISGSVLVQPKASLIFTGFTVSVVVVTLRHTLMAPVVSPVFHLKV